MKDKKDNMEEFENERLPLSGPGERSPEAPHIEGYEILELLGKGGMGNVWRAKQLSTSREVALKVMSREILGSSEAKKRFEREVELAARLEHPNIARVYDSGVHQQVYYYAMELLEGEPLDQYVFDQECSSRETLELMQTVCQAVQYAHQRGIIHRDLKPSNIYVTPDGQPHILDFGLARDLLSKDQDRKLSIAGSIMGTLIFMSPEQAAGNTDGVDTRSDVYSLGVIQYYLLTHDWPYDVTGSDYEILKNIQEQEPNRPRNMERRFDSDLEAILLKALAKDSDQRYQSLSELEHDITCWLEGLPIVSRSVNSLYLLRKIIKRHRYATAVVGSLALIVLAFGLIIQDVYRSKIKADAYSEALEEVWEEQNRADAEFFPELWFSNFLDKWNQGDLDKAGWIKNAILSNGSVIYGKAADFLMDPHIDAGKITHLESAFKEHEQDRWFAYYILGEYSLKQNDPNEAIKYYNQAISFLDPSHSRQSVLSRMAENHLKAQLFELMSK